MHLATLPRSDGNLLELYCSIDSPLRVCLSPGQDQNIQEEKKSNNFKAGEFRTRVE